MAEKLEKSEAGRKKLRQAISMLKEKVEANEKVLQVNEILRQGKCRPWLILISFCNDGIPRWPVRNFFLILNVFVNF
jgi:hypothetical protein